ncbi:helix-turn-helix domain-containing protein [Bacillus sp. KH172YL63]|uniref:helix-turn-helix domain-containing protein n=1 Tax=Bacillus sp. KH172YL63 TaxID=2709784 RepID=UPI0013E43371|nr:helix-turn-helix transcriptional regulator [Bacillus sp. KH172YL63]BCB03689.1 hypothetical protein KH172YL63_18220 [Bacillus sp. KH172YL63]
MSDLMKLCNSINQCLVRPGSRRDELHIGEIVYILRVKSRLTQEDLAQKAKVCAQTVKRLEGGKGKVSDFTCRAIFKALGVHITLLTKLLDD